MGEIELLISCFLGGFSGSLFGQGVMDRFVRLRLEREGTEKPQKRSMFHVKRKGKGRVYRMSDKQLYEREIEKRKKEQEAHDR